VITCDKLGDIKSRTFHLEEIQELFQTTNREYPVSTTRFPEFTESLQSRDRAMLAIFYGCGARRNEGMHLNLEDINWDRKVLHIKKGKRYKERLVPIGKQALSYLQEWVYDYRPLWIRSKKVDALFISERGTRVGGQTLLLRLKIVQGLSKDEHLKQKEIGLHSLRHSIANHLLQNGMQLESISKFLGHGSLEPTQIYTHLVPSSNEF
jgi:integrase/recombinase XerD